MGKAGLSDMTTRYCNTLFAAICLSVLLTTTHAFATQVSIADTTVVYKTPGVYAAFPGLFKAEDGTLVVTFTTRVTESHYDMTGGSKSLISKDGGQTWQEPDHIYLNPAYKTRDGRYVIPAPNSWRETTADNAAKLTAAGVTVNQSNGKYYYATGASLTISKDKGRTWTKKDLQLPQHSLLMGYNVASNLKTSKGIRLQAVYGKIKSTEKDRTFLLRSDESGRSWQLRALSTYYSGFNETALVETRDGSVLAMMRSNPDLDGYLYSAVSKDSGYTWSTPKKTKIWGYPASLYRLPDNRILCLYGYRKAPMGIRAVILASDYVNIDGNEMILRDDAVGSVANVGYPVVVESQGKLVVAYYITGQDGITGIAVTRLNMTGN